MSTSKMPSRSVSIKIDENTYEIQFPNNRNLKRIQALKHEFSFGRYNDFCTDPTTEGQYERYSAEAQAWFTVSNDKLKQDLKVESLGDLDALTMKKLTTVYIKTLLPWITEWYTILNSDDTEKKEGEQVSS